jgi:hypothetical protein
MKQYVQTTGIIAVNLLSIGIKAEIPLKNKPYSLD